MENDERNERGRLTVEQVMEILRKKRIEISKEKAEEVLEILRLFADTLIENYLRNRVVRPIPLKRKRNTKRKIIEYNLNQEP